MPMPPIEFHVSMFRDERDQARSQYVLLFLMEALVRCNQSLIRDGENREKMGIGKKWPLLYKAGVHYEREPPGQEHWPDLSKLLALFDGPGQYPGPWGDCLPVSTLVLRDDHQLVPLGIVRPGDRIMGHEGWTGITEQAVTGEKPILAFDLNNGSTLRCSPDHRLFLADGTEIRAEDVKVGSHLLQPSTVPDGTEWRGDQSAIAPNDLAWLIGTYVADGWSDSPRHPRFCISGKDPRPDGEPRLKRDKTAQKKRAQQIAEDAGMTTRWHERYLAVNDGDLATLMTSCGRHAPEKHLPSLALSQAQVRAALDGLGADAYTTSGGTTVFGTTSALLALQVRVLYRMLGQSVHIRRWDDHGGLGTHPMYRVTVRRHPDELDRKNVRPSARVTAIRAEEEEELCCDITTESGRFWLPESDVIVHNCEDLACWRTAELREAASHKGSNGEKIPGGVKARPFAKWRRGPEGQFNYHALVLRPDGKIEDPSLVLGMRKEAQFAANNTAQKLKDGTEKPVIQFAKAPDVMVVDPDSPNGFLNRTDAKGLIGKPGAAKTAATDVVGRAARELRSRPRVSLNEAQRKLIEGTIGSYGVVNPEVNLDLVGADPNTDFGSDGGDVSLGDDPTADDGPLAPPVREPVPANLSPSDVRDVAERVGRLETVQYGKKEPYGLGLLKRSVKAEAERIMRALMTRV